MNQMETFVCPKGHVSSEPDYCSECGARIGDEAVVAAGSAGAEPEHCPECGAAREQLGIVFCEICGYNFATGAKGGDPVMPLPVPPVFVAPVSAGVSAVSSAVAGSSSSAASSAGSGFSVGVAAGQTWTVVVSVDPALRDALSPEAPVDRAPVTVALTTAVSLIGRRSQARAIFPEIDLSYDDAVSHRHALLQVDSAGMLTLRDIGASNGTRLNHQMVEPLKDHALAAGDEITLGHWSKLVVQAGN